STEEGGKPLPIELAIPALTLDMDKQTLQAPEFALTVAPAKIRGQLSGEKILDAPAFTGRITLDQVSPRELFKTLDIEAPQTADANVLKAVTLEAAVAATANNVMLSDMKMKLDDTSLTGSLGVTDFETTALKFALVVDSIDVDRYLPPEPAEAPKGAAGKES